MELSTQIKKLYDLESTSQLGLAVDDCNKYSISMFNKYLDGAGNVVKWQKLTSTYIRRTIEAQKGIFAINDYHFNRVIFSSNQKHSPLHWSFAENFSLPYYLVSRNYLGQKDKYADIRTKVRQCEDKFQNSVNCFPKLPSVYLFIMQIYDIISFEIFACALTGIQLSSKNICKTERLEALSESKFNLGMGFYSNKSFFENGEFNTTFIGYTYYKGKACALFSYKCDGSKVKIVDDTVQAQRAGSSFYTGMLFIDLRNWSMVYGTMQEDYIAVQNNKNIRVKRLVKLT